MSNRRFCFYGFFFLLIDLFCFCPGLSICADLPSVLIWLPVGQIFVVYPLFFGSKPIEIFNPLTETEVTLFMPCPLSGHCSDVHLWRIIYLGNGWYYMSLGDMYFSPYCTYSWYYTVSTIMRKGLHLERAIFNRIAGIWHFLYRISRKHSFHPLKAWWVANAV